MPTINANICIRRDSAANWTSNNPTMLAGEIGYETDTGRFKIGTGAAWSVTDYAKSSERVSVKDFGAKGDGTTDDTAAISAAITAAMGKTLFLPNGTYRMTQTGTNQISKVLTDNISIIGDNAVLRADPATQVHQMLYITNCAGFSVSISGLTFDGNQKSQSLLRIDNTTGTAGACTNTVSIDNCEFKNGLGKIGGVGGFTGSIGILVAGGYRRVNITNTNVVDLNREVGSNSVGSTGTQGIAIAPQGGLHCESANISGCLISNILNSETTGNPNNQDTDGLSVFGGLNTGGSTYIPCSATITNNAFVNCKGRAIKIQNDETIVANNVFRFAIKPCASSNTASASFGGIVNFQVPAGTIKDNVFHYDPAPGNTSPFSVTNTADPGSGVISYFVTGTDQRPRSVTVTNNIVFNNVPEAVGVLASVIDTSEGSMPAGAAAVPLFASVKENRVLGGAVKYFMNTALRLSNAGKMFLTISDNAISKILTAFMCNSSSGSYDNNIIVCTNNIHGTATDVIHLENTGTNTLYPAQITAMNNVNIGRETEKLRTTTTSFLPRIGGLSPTESVGSQFSMQVVTLAAGADFTFPQRTHVSNGGLRLISGTTFGGDVNAMFSGASGALVQHFVGSSAVVVAASGTAGTTANKIHIGQNGGLVQVRNTFGSPFTITLFSWG